MSLVRMYGALANRHECDVEVEFLRCMTDVIDRMTNSDGNASSEEWI